MFYLSFVYNLDAEKSFFKFGWEFFAWAPNLSGYNYWMCPFLHILGGRGRTYKPAKFVGIYHSNLHTWFSISGKVSNRKLPPPPFSPLCGPVNLYTTVGMWFPLTEVVREYSATQYTYDSMMYNPSPAAKCADDRTHRGFLWSQYQRPENWKGSLL